MFDYKTLNTESIYQINGENGEWHYSSYNQGVRGNKYIFWRFAVNNSKRRVNLALTREAVQRRVTQEVKALDLSK